MMIPFLLPIPLIPCSAGVSIQISAAPVAQRVGKKAPDFTLMDQNDKKVSLRDFRGMWVVLAFYPVDMTSGCTLQNRAYTKALDDMTALGAKVLTVSGQDSASKRLFCAKESLTHTLLSDTLGSVIHAYGVAREGSDAKTPIAKRNTFYINPEGKIVAVDTKVKPVSAAEDSLAILALLGVTKKE